MIWNNLNCINFLYKQRGDVLFECKEVKMTRTKAQNNFLWAYYENIKKALIEKEGLFHTEQEIHEWLKDKLLKWTYVKNPLTWKRIVRRKSTTKLSKKEFTQYIKDIEMYLYREYELSVMLPTDEWLFFNW